MLAPDSKLAVITGASRGIGARIAKELSENGYIVLLLARSAEGLNQVAGYIQAEGGAAHSMAVDLSKDEDVERVARFIGESKAKVSLLVHNAGIAKVDTIENMKSDDWRKILDVNITGPFLLTQKMLPFMKEGSQIIFINSVAGRQAFPEWAAYSVSKHGLRALAEALRQEVDSRGIRVTSIYPSSVNTSLHDELPYDWDRSKMLKAVDIANAVMYCIKQPPNVRINEIDLENIAGKF